MSRSGTNGDILPHEVVLKNEHEGDRLFNLEKSAFCFSKAAKYDSLMGSESLELIKLIPKYINWFKQIVINLTYN